MLMPQLERCPGCNDWLFGEDDLNQYYVTWSDWACPTCDFDFTYMWYHTDLLWCQYPDTVRRYTSEITICCGRMSDVCTCINSLPFSSVIEMLTHTQIDIANAYHFDTLREADCRSCVHHLEPTCPPLIKELEWIWWNNGIPVNSIRPCLNYAFNPDAAELLKNKGLTETLVLALYNLKPTKKEVSQ